MASKNEALRIKFIKFLADPSRGKSQEAWAKENKIHPITLTKWKREPEFKRMFLAEVESNLADVISDVYEKIKQRAKVGDYNFVVLLLKQYDALKAEKIKNEHDVNTDPFRELVEIIKEEVAGAKDGKENITPETKGDKGQVAEDIS